jgi:mitochondrial chaperone BCS1
MAAFNNASSLPFQSIPFPQISIVDVFLPGFAGMSPAIQQLLAGNLNSYAGLLCICGILVFLGRHAYEYLWELVDKFLSS